MLLNVTPLGFFFFKFPGANKNQEYEAWPMLVELPGREGESGAGCL